MKIYNDKQNNVKPYFDKPRMKEVPMLVVPSIYNKNEKKVGKNNNSFYQLKRRITIKKGGERRRKEKGKTIPFYASNHLKFGLQKNLSYQKIYTKL